MSYSKPKQIESIRSAIFDNEEKPWRIRHRSGFRKFLKKSVHRHERTKKKSDISCDIGSKEYFGFEY